MLIKDPAQSLRLAWHMGQFWIVKLIDFPCTLLCLVVFTLIAQVLIPESLPVICDVKPGYDSAGRYGPLR